MKMSKQMKAPPNTSRKIRDAIKACQKKGIEIVRDKWGVVMDEEKKYFVMAEKVVPSATQGVCALGALLIHKNGSIKFNAFRGRRPLSDVEEIETAAFVLGVSEEWVGHFVAGFDEDVSEADESIRDDDGEILPVNKLKTVRQKELYRAFKMGERFAKDFIK